MSTTTTTVPAQANIRRIVLSSVVGTAIEWYDFFLYATASALIFNQLFFPTFDPIVGTIAAFGTFAVGYLARPLGAVAFGHLGDRVGRKSALVATLTIMGVCTCIIGLLPGYDTIGVWAPALLIAMRFCQGLAVGGEWGGAVLIVVESAPEHRRGFFGAFPQIGVPIGLIVSTSVFKLVASLPQPQFLSWGWRIPFLLSIVLVGIGLFIRLTVAESPAFAALRAEDGIVKAPLVELLRDHGRNVLLALGTRFATDITFNVINVFVLAYAVQTLGLDRGMMLNAIIAGSCVALVTIPCSGAYQTPSTAALYSWAAAYSSPCMVSCSFGYCRRSSPGWSSLPMSAARLSASPASTVSSLPGSLRSSARACATPAPHFLTSVRVS